MMKNKKQNIIIKLAIIYQKKYHVNIEYSNDEKIIWKKKKYIYLIY